MRRLLWITFFAVAFSLSAQAKQKVLTFGRWLTVKWMVGQNEDKQVPLKVRAILVNSEAKEFTTGEPHDVTDRIFVVQRAVRLNDVLPTDENVVPKWKWQPGGWLVVNRGTTHIGNLTLPMFDPYYSQVSWYRDLAAYCGISDDGEKVYAMVTQIGRRKPLLKKLLGPAHFGELPGSECELPAWQKQPMRVTFAPSGGQKTTYSIRGQAVEIAPGEGEEPENNLSRE